MKVCLKCRESKPATNEYFGNRKASNYGLYYFCKVCMKALNKAYKSNPANKLKLKEYYKDYYSTPKGKERTKEYNKKHPQKVKARKNLNNALRDNKIIKPLLCTICQEEKPLDGHHYSYDMPLDVIWLCRQCHNDLHTKLTKVYTIE